MVKHSILALGVALLSGCVSPQMTMDAAPVVERFAGDQEKIAACVYLDLEKEHPEDLHIADLRGAKMTRIYQQTGNSVMMVRTFDLTLVQETPDTVRAEARSFASNDAQAHMFVLPAVRRCAAS